MKNQKGITLIALVITIIVMLILVGVSVTIALNGGLFTTAKNASQKTMDARDEELELDSDARRIEIGGVWYDSIKDYPNTPSANQSGSVEGEGGSGGEGTEPGGGIVITPSTYAVGDRVTIGDEAFYVIANDDDEVKLLTEYCIVADAQSEDYLKQSLTAEKVIFSSEKYWSNESKYPADLNNLEKYPITEGTSIVTIAKEYGEKFNTTGVIGRLMELEEVVELGGDSEECLTSGCPEFINRINDYRHYYWLSTAYNDNNIYVVDGYSKILDICYNDGSSGTGGVRPVLVIPKSLL